MFTSKVKDTRQIATPLLVCGELASCSLLPIHFNLVVLYLVSTSIVRLKVTPQNEILVGMHLLVESHPYR